MQPGSTPLHKLGSPPAGGDGPDPGQAPPRVEEAHPSAGACTIRHLAQEEIARWDAFVSGAADATFFHRAAWRDIIEHELGHRTHYLFVERDGQITGVLPLAEIRSKLFGHALISTPLCVYGGVVARDAESETCLTQAAADLADNLNVDYLELRSRKRGPANWPVKELYVGFCKPIFADDESNLQSFSADRRATIRKSTRRGLAAHHDGTVEEFYPVYAESVRNLGTPVLRRRYYAALQQTFGAECETTVITHAGKPVATVMNFYFRDKVHTYYGGSLPQGRALKANDFMYWSVMQRAIERGASVYDFGRSKLGTGSYRFKQHWGFEPEPLPYAYHLVRAKEVPNISPTNRKYHLFIEAWKRLPLSVACTVGPFLARDLG